eukprot:COSAG01_NODE_56841_length_316_cov_0.539171_2_plen_39_part_01
MVALPTVPETVIAALAMETTVTVVVVPQVWPGLFTKRSF